jgi:uncharacterized paraquat-inducible protein A
MRLRKCPACRETVGAESPECPRCGVNFRAAAFRRWLTRFIAGAVILFVVGYYVFKKF